MLHCRLALDILKRRGQHSPTHERDGTHNKSMKQTHTILLRQERELRGWSRAYIAEQVEVDIATVGRWERGERLPHSHYRQKLCALFEKSARDLGLLSDVSEKCDEVTATLDLHSQISSINEKSTTQSPAPKQPVSTSQPIENHFPVLKTFSAEREPSLSKASIRMNQQNRQRMLRKMYTFWINGVLEQSLHGADLIALELEEQHNAVTNPWMVTLQQPELEPRPLPPGLHISQIYDEVDGELLILGEPGSGKTTLLLELARTLLERAIQEETHPIPVVFNLASWAIKQQFLSDWLVEELHSKYQVPRKLAHTWVQTEQILPLLDGLDEVTVDARSTCIDTINAYRQDHGLLPMVVCSRLTDYFVQSTRLFLHRAVTVQPLRAWQIEAYLINSGEELATLRCALQTDPTLQELASNPLMLSILTLTYRENVIAVLPESLSPEVRRREVFSNYIGRMFTHRKSRNRYTTEQTLHWLAWLAKQLAQQQQTEFYIEKMQPHWLANARTFRWYCRLLIGLLMGLFGGITGMMADVPLYEMVHKQLFVLLTHSVVSNAQCADTLPAFGTIAETIASLLSLPIVGLLYGIGFGLAGGLIGGLLGCRNHQLQPIGIHTRPNRLYQRGLTLLLGLGCGSIFVLINLLWVPCPLPPGLYNQVAEELSYGLAGMFLGGLIGVLTEDMFGTRKSQVQPVEVLVWTRASSRRRAISSLLGGALGILVGGGTGLVSEVYLNFALWQKHLLISALIGGLLGSIIGGEFGGFSQHMLEKGKLVKPNEGIRRSAHNGLIIGLPIGLTLSSFALGLVLWWSPANFSDGLLWCFPLGLIVAMLLFLLNGGYACLQHMVLRSILYFQGYIPWNYARFLDEAAERLLLRKVGGGYIFIHRLLLEYFASEVTSTQEKHHASLEHHSPRKKMNTVAINPAKTPRNTRRKKNEPAVEAD
jgi:transcriptional regulator with XRE-family HTH domain/DNA polymerase III delta prime subunit